MGTINIIDVEEPARQDPGPWPGLEFGRNLDTVEKARRWLTHPKNWRKTQLFIIIWDGSIPYISERHGQKMIDEPWDDSLTQVVVIGQHRLKNSVEDVERALERSDDE
jgi:hypothetical protein